MIPKSVLKNRIPMKAPFGMTGNYYLLLCGFFISSIGDWFYQLALPLLVYEITGSALSMAVTYGLTYLPFILFLPFGGVIADRVNRRRLLVIGDFASAVIVGLLAFIVWQGVRSVWIIYPVALILAGVSPFYHPAFQSLVPSVTEEHKLPQANAWLQTADNLVSLAGPLIGGVFIAAIGTTSALFLDALSFLVSALIIAAIRIKTVEAFQVETNTDSSWLADLVEGFQYIWKNPILRFGSLLFMQANFVTTMIQANYVYFLTEILDFTPDKIGLAFALPGLGAIVGALLVPKLSKMFKPGTLILGCDVIAGLITLPLLTAKSLLSVAIPWAIVTALATITNVTWFTLRQQIAPQRILGRVIALTRLIAFTAIPVGAVIGGAILGATKNIYLIIVFVAFMRMAVASLGFLTPFYRHKLQTPETLDVYHQTKNE